MPRDATDADRRKQVLEQKKAKLAAIRADKARREQQSKAGTGGRLTRASTRLAAQTPSAESTSTTTTNTNVDTDALLESLGLNDRQPTTVETPTQPETNVATETAIIPNGSITNQENIKSINSTDNTQQPPPKPRILPKLATSNISLLELVPKDIIHYAKETQTLVIESSEDEDEKLENQRLEEENRKKQEEIERLQNESKIEDDSDNAQNKENQPIKIYKELTEEEQENIFKKDEFQHFLDKTTKYVERALWETDGLPDLMINYQISDEDKNLNENSTKILSQNRTFSDPNYTNDRIVEAIEWSENFPELVYVAYGEKQKANLNEPEGIVCVWNMKFKKPTPEFVFHCNSPIKSLVLSPYNPNLIIGGTHSGQVVVWDTKSRKRNPIQRSKYGNGAHTHPIFRLHIVGSRNAHNLISISNDGRVCSWSLDMLAQPQEFLDLIHPTDKRRSISVMGSSWS